MIFPSVLALVLAALIGVSLGVLGSGGSIITLPVLVYIAHVPAQEAVGMSMAIVGATSLFGALIQWRQGNLSPKAMSIFSVVGMAGAYLGSSGTHLLSKQALLLLFAAVMLLVGLLMLRGRAGAHSGKACRILPCLVVGFVVGLFTGFLGVGGGFLIVPALVLAAGLDTKMASGTSLAIIALNSVTGLLGQLRYVRVDWSLFAGFLLFACIGMVAGLAFARRAPDKLLRRLFALALIVLAIIIAVLNF